MPPPWSLMAQMASAGSQMPPRCLPEGLPDASQRAPRPGSLAALVIPLQGDEQEKFHENVLA